MDTFSFDNIGSGSSISRSELVAQWLGLNSLSLCSYFPTTMVGYLEYSERGRAVGYPEYSERGRAGLLKTVLGRHLMRAGKEITYSS